MCDKNTEMETEMNTEVKREMRTIMNFIKIHKYPTFNEIFSNILRDGRYDLLRYYDKTIHCLCEKIYQNFANTNLVKECGIKIDKYQGFDGMLAALYTIRLYSPIRQSNNFIVRQVPSIIECYWDGIGKWQY